MIAENEIATPAIRFFHKLQHSKLVESPVLITLYIGSTEYYIAHNLSNQLIIQSDRDIKLS